MLKILESYGIPWNTSAEVIIKAISILYSDTKTSIQTTYWETELFEKFRGVFL